jgi:hypothetical protein
MSDLTATHNVDVEYQIVPEDLCPQAVKVARRLQNLPDERFYVILLAKVDRDEWVLSLLNDRGVKLEWVR